VEASEHDFEVNMKISKPSGAYMSQDATTGRSMQISRCGIHGFHEVLGIDTDEIRFYWAIESEDKNAWRFLASGCGGQ
jgi:hypothetical protein